VAALDAKRAQMTAAAFPAAAVICDLRSEHCALVLSFLDLFDDLGDKGFEIAGVAARDDALFGHDGLIDPVGTGIEHVRLDRIV